MPRLVALTFPIDIAKTGLAQAQVTLQNPFTASVNLLQVLTDATYQGIYLGQVDVRGLCFPIYAALPLTLSRRAGEAQPGLLGRRQDDGDVKQPRVSLPVCSLSRAVDLTISRIRSFALNTNPKDLIRFLEAVASANGVDLGILGALLPSVCLLKRSR